MKEKNVELKESKPVASVESKPVDEVNKQVKVAEVKKIKRDEVRAVGDNLTISLKHSMYLSKFIKGKSIDQALNELAEVVALRRAIPFKGEIPHRSQPGIMSGRYPKLASQEFIRVIKNLKGNAIASGLDLERTKIYYSSPSWASRPVRRGGSKAKRVYLTIKAKEIKEEKK